MYSFKKSGHKFSGNSRNVHPETEKVPEGNISLYDLGNLVAASSV